MSDDASYGRAFARRFGAETAPAFVSRTLSKSLAAVTYLQQLHPTHELSDRLPVHDAYLVSYVLLTNPTYSFWQNDRFISTRAVPAGETTFNDFRTNPRMLVNTPMEALHFYFPRAAFDAIADACDARRIGDLDCPQGYGTDDSVMRGLATALMPAFAHPDQASRIFLDHVTTAVGAHIAHAYGGMRIATLKRGGLAPWQERRALEIIEAHLDGDITQSWLAAECGLSVSQFARSFRVSTGLSPHQWLLHRRVERAKAALRETNLPMHAIAQDCGFADQSHLSRVFRRIVGQPPSHWARTVKS